MPESQLSTDTYEAIDRIVRIANVAVAKAQDESRQMGVPNVYSINGRIYYETPTGELSATDPYTNGSQATEHLYGLSSQARIRVVCRKSLLFFE